MESVRAAVGDWAQQVKTNAGWLVVLGVVTVAAGVLTMAAPQFAGLGIGMLVGIAMVIAGVARSASAFSAGSFGQGTLAFIGGILTFAAGVILTARPGIGLAAITLLLGGCLLIDGISGSLLAFNLRPASGWGWMLFSALMGVILGFLLLRDWPLSGLVAIGTLVGINLLFAGISIISVGSSARSLAKRLA